MYEISYITKSLENFMEVLRHDAKFSRSNCDRIIYNLTIPQIDTFESCGIQNFEYYNSITIIRKIIFLVGKSNIIFRNCIPNYLTCSKKNLYFLCAKNKIYLIKEHPKCELSTWILKLAALSETGKSIVHWVKMKVWKKCFLIKKINIYSSRACSAPYFS